jgi:pimeloyl-ACP methyl ester carboxylesterase
MVTQVLLLPGSVLPAEPAYRSLIDVLGPGVDARAKELEIYATDRPRSDYALDDEVDGLLRFADEAGFETFHAVGYSAGGAFVLATLASHPDRLRSVALLEPAWAGWVDMVAAEAAMWERIRHVMRLPDDQMMRDFVEIELAPGVPVPDPPMPQPAWMAKRPAGLRSIARAFDATDLDPAALRSFTRPAYFALGGLSHPDLYACTAKRLATILPDLTIERFEERHHFDPPHRVEPERLGLSLQALWTRAETGTPDVH